MKVEVNAFNRILSDFYGVELSEEEKKWFALDGKELKGSILHGDKRGDATVLAVRHEDREVYAQNFFHGKKESEVAAARSLLNATLAEQKVTMDALHFKPLTLEPIQQAGGTYLIGLKENQKELLAEMKFCAVQQKPTFTYQTDWEKGHGRKEQRNYNSFDLHGAYIDKRWDDSGMKTLIQVERQRIVCRGEIELNTSVQISYFISNMEVQNKDQALELFGAVRDHWQVETANNDRDCILSEDKSKCKFTRVNQVMASCRTLVIKMLKKHSTKNRAEVLDDFSADFQQCCSFLKESNFL